MQVPQVSNLSNSNIDEAFSPQFQSNALTNLARTIGTAAGYLQRSSSEDVIADVEGLLLRSPERSVLAAAAVGLLLGTVLRNRR